MKSLLDFLQTQGTSVVKETVHKKQLEKGWGSECKQRIKMRIKIWVKRKIRAGRGADILVSSVLLRKRQGESGPDGRYTAKPEQIKEAGR